MQWVLPKTREMRRQFPNTFVFTQYGSDLGFIVHMVATRVIRVEVQVVDGNRDFNELRLRSSLARDQIDLSLLVCGESIDM